jgi:hypothetical protein
VDECEPLATGFMRAWLRHQPRFAQLEGEYAAQLGGGADTPATVLELFRRAAAVAPRDADVHAVLGRAVQVGSIKTHSESAYGFTA